MQQNYDNVMALPIHIGVVDILCQSGRNLS